MAGANMQQPQVEIDRKVRLFSALIRIFFTFLKKLSLSQVRGETQW